MKKFIFTLAVSAALLSSGFAYANEPEPAPLVKQAFAKEFAEVKNVQWKNVSHEGIYQASFSFNNETLMAYFTEDGEFLGTVRQIRPSQLPVMVLKVLDQKYPAERVVTVFEQSTADSVAYFITLAGKKASLIIRAAGTGDLTVYRRIKQKL